MNDIMTCIIDPSLRPETNALVSETGKIGFEVWEEGAGGSFSTMIYWSFTLGTPYISGYRYLIGRLRVWLHEIPKTQSSTMFRVSRMLKPLHTPLSRSTIALQPFDNSSSVMCTQFILQTTSEIRPSPATTGTKKGTKRDPHFRWSVNQFPKHVKSKFPCFWKITIRGKKGEILVYNQIHLRNRATTFGTSGWNQSRCKKNRVGKYPTEMRQPRFIG